MSGDFSAFLFHSVLREDLEVFAVEGGLLGD